MLRSLWLSLVYGVFLCGGFVAPFVLGLGYVWVDNFTPQNIAYEILNQFPVSAVMAGAALLAYVLKDRRHPPVPNAIMAQIVLMALWVTFTVFNAPVAPDLAWTKYDWAIKTILFAAFMPYLFRSRVQIEAFVQIYLFSVAVQIWPYAVKTIVSGGSYYQNLGLVSGNSGLAEGSTLATVAIMTVPLILWLRRHTLILPRTRLVRLMYLGMAAAAVAASIGTFERTGLIAIMIGAVALWLQSRHRLRNAVLGAAALGVVAYSMMGEQSKWLDRMSTITQYSQENSALGRILVWQWTLDFARTHPFGGGFNAFYVDTITYPAVGNAPPVVIHGKAFHSSYFEMLGEHGWPGLGLFLLMLGTTFLTLLRINRVSRRLPNMEWCRDLSVSLMVTEVILMACGAFIGIAFQPETYYLFAMTAMLACHLRGMERAVRPRAPSTAAFDESYFAEPIYGR